MTAATHPSGTDRLQETVAALGLPGEAIVVNVQGDEPLIPPEVIDQVAANLSHAADCGMATLCEALDSVEAFLDPNIVKLVRDDRSRAIYFSRAPIPWPRDAFAADRTRLPEGFRPLRHIGIYAYRVEFLHRFVGWPLGVLEGLESLEQLRALEHGVGIHADHACAAIPGGVDTPADLVRVNALLTKPTA
jgi:3-deoxy-manno-octulosonate cytidylyltransferase (CMP-KDO synthetase)